MIRKMMMLSLIISLMSSFGCDKRNEDLENALTTLMAEDLSQDIAVLASDEFEGRAPSSRGEELTINFLKEEFQKLGLQPGNGSSYFQEVPLVAITVSSQPVLKIKNGNTRTEYQYGDDFMAWTKRVVGRSSLDDSEVIFVGYGVVAPEYDWNDYEGLDVGGKTVVMLVNDPGFVTQDETLFNGNAMTYYGRWTYKFEEAARQGAAGAFIIHERKPAGYPWEVVRGSWSGKQFDLLSSDNNMSRCAVEGWVTHETASQIFTNAGQSLDSLKNAAASREFKAIPLGMNVSVTLENNIEHSRSNNVIAVLPGTELKDEYIFYMAHWDHFGLDPNLEGDKIYNGALDNATGTAALIELAEAFTKLENPPLRSIAFLAVTAEEQGLLGSQYYASNPIYPTTKTVAAINIDGLNIFGEMKDITIVGYGNSELDDYVESAAEAQGRVVEPDPEPEKGYFYRSDHFSFAKVGIPALYTDPGIDHIEHGKEWTLQQKEKYTEENYHKPSDEFDPNWDLSGAVQDLRLLCRVGYELSMESAFPNWKEGTEFKAKREAEMQAALRQSSK